MQPRKEFVGLPKAFWANIRTISQKVGYMVRPKRVKGVEGQAGPIKVPTMWEIKTALESIGLTSNHLVREDGGATDLGKQVVDYYEYRADVLNRVVEPLLMDAAKAESLYNSLQAKLKSNTSVPMNKQSDDKKKPAFFTGIINMLIEANIEGLPCNYNPQELPRKRII